MQAKIKGIIFDIDGVLEYQGKVYPEAVRTIEALRDRGIAIRLLTNSTLKSRKSCAEKLRQYGFLVYDNEVITASYATAMYLKEKKPRSCWVMLEGEGLKEFQGFPKDMESPQYIVVGDNRSKFDFAHLNKALRLLLKGSTLIGMQAELTDTSLGEPELNVGSWVKMLELASGMKATYIGKPNRYVFDFTLKTMELGKNEVVMVGDQISTDIKGAKAFGIRSILIKTGEYDEKELDGCITPDYLIDSISDVLDIAKKSM
jgi:HAD superfamily hydrolase (TIGR01458 family)